MKLRLCLSLLFLVGSTSLLWAAQKQLAPGHIPAAISHDRMAPLGRLPSTNQLALTLGLPLHNRAALNQFLRDLYNPASPQYHHYLKPAEFATRFGPTAEEYQSILQFAATNHLRVTGTSSNRMILNVTGRSADVERAFHVHLKTFRHPREKRNFFAPDAEPTVDSTVPLMDVSGLNNYDPPHPCVQIQKPPGKIKGGPMDGSSPDGSYMGADFRAAYVPGTSLQGQGQTVGLFQFDGYDPNDIATYASEAGQTNIPLQNILLNGVDGTPSTNVFHVLEVCLDIEMTMSMAPALNQILVYEGTDPNTILNQMAVDDAAEQLSCSWDWSGNPDATTDQIFQQMAAQGQSFFTASGDSAAYTSGPSGNANLIPTPVDNPYVTSVGGTALLTTGPGGSRVGETTWNFGFGTGSSGGSSSFYALPSWQQGIDMSVNGGSTTYRNIPDVAMVGENVYVVFYSGYSGDAAGTSCAAPLWAGFTALINQQAAQLGQPSAGFLNPALYALSIGTNYNAIFNDITSGDNTSPASPTNYYAVTGYDLCTGWGTPNGSNLINALTTPDYLGVPAVSNFSSAGLVGGPFTPTNWVIYLTNSGAADLPWSAGVLPAWATVTPASGTLPAFSSIALQLALTACAEHLPTANNSAALEVTNFTTGRVQIAAMVTLAIGQTIVQNGGFETGDFSDWNLTGDTATNNLVYNVVGSAAEFPDIVHSGYYGAFLGELDYEATLSQTLPTTIGKLYLVSFWLSNPQAGNVQQFDASWDGTNFIDLLNPPAFAWSNLVLVATATQTNTVLEFGAENDPDYFGFDDVSVLPVPPVQFAGLSLQTNGLQLAWFSLPMLNYQVQSTTNLTSPAWNNLGSLTATTNITTFVDTNAANTQVPGFYRLILLP